jgi:hypothetical protein
VGISTIIQTPSAAHYESRQEKSGTAQNPPTAEKTDTHETKLHLLSLLEDMSHSEVAMERVAAELINKRIEPIKDLTPLGQIHQNNPLERKAARHLYQRGQLIETGVQGVYAQDYIESLEALQRSITMTEGQRPEFDFGIEPLAKGLVAECLFYIVASKLEDEGITLEVPSINADRLGVDFVLGINEKRYPIDVTTITNGAIKGKYLNNRIVAYIPVDTARFNSRQRSELDEFIESTNLSIQNTHKATAAEMLYLIADYNLELLEAFVRNGGLDETITDRNITFWESVQSVCDFNLPASESL